MESGVFTGKTRNLGLLLMAVLLTASLGLAQGDSATPARSDLPSLPPTEYKPRFSGDPARSQSEALALGYMRTVVDAQRQYHKKNPKYATSLQALVGSGSFTRRMLRADRGEYTATFSSASKGQKYSLQMIPKQFDTMRRAFFVNETGIIRAEPEKPASAESPVLRPDRS